MHQQVGIAGDEKTGLICLQTNDSLTLLNFSNQTQQVPVAAEWELALSSNLPGVGGLLPPYSAHVYLHAGG